MTRTVRSREITLVEPAPIEGTVVTYQTLAKQIKDADAAEIAAQGDRLWNRWEFGRKLLAERKGKQLPAGRLDEVCAEVDRSRREVQKWVQFAEQYPTEAKVRRADALHQSWESIKGTLTTSRTITSGENLPEVEPEVTHGRGEHYRTPKARHATPRLSGGYPELDTQEPGCKACGKPGDLYHVRCIPWTD